MPANRLRIDVSANCRNARQKQRHKGRDGCEYLRDWKVLSQETTHEGYAHATRADKWLAYLALSKFDVASGSRRSELSSDINARLDLILSFRG